MKDITLGQISAGASIIAILIAALFWIFQSNATANEAMRMTRENRVMIEAKADADDVRRLDQDIRDLRKALEDSEVISRKR